MKTEDVYRAPCEAAPVADPAPSVAYRSQVGLLQLLSLALFCCAGCAGLSSFLSSWILYLHHAPTPTQALDLGLLIAMTRTAASALVGSALVTITCGTAFLGTARRNARALGEAPANTHAAARQALAALCMPVVGALLLVAQAQWNARGSLEALARSIEAGLGLACAVAALRGWRLLRRIHKDQEAAYARL